MKAIIQDRYGEADVLEFGDVEEPVVGEHDVLIRVRAAGAGPDVWHIMAGKPYMARPMLGWSRPKIPIRGWDVAGTVEAVGSAVTEFKPGDEVMGSAERGSFAELTVAPADKLVRKPERLTFEQAAAVPVSGTTAIQAVRDKGHVRPGQSVLVIGAGGGVGTFTVQIAKAHGRDGDRRGEHVEAGSRPLDRRGRRDRLHARGLHGRLSAVGRDRRHGGAPPAPGAPPRAHAEGNARGRRRRRRRPVDRRLLPRDAPRADRVPVRGSDARRDQREGHRGGPGALSELIEAGSVTPVVDRTFDLVEAADAVRYLAEGHAAGKIVVTV